MGVGRQVELNFEENTTQVLTEWPRYAEMCPVCGCGKRERWPVFRYLDNYRSAAQRERDAQGSKNCLAVEAMPATGHVV